MRRLRGSGRPLQLGAPLCLPRPCRSLPGLPHRGGRRSSYRMAPPAPPRRTATATGRRPPGKGPCYWPDHCFRPSHPHKKPWRSAKAPEGPERSGGGAQRLAAARTPGLRCLVMACVRLSTTQTIRPAMPNKPPIRRLRVPTDAPLLSLSHCPKNGVHLSLSTAAEPSRCWGRDPLGSHADLPGRGSHSSHLPRSSLVCPGPRRFRSRGSSFREPRSSRPSSRSAKRTTQGPPGVSAIPTGSPANAMLTKT